VLVTVLVVGTVTVLVAVDDVVTVLV